METAGIEKQNVRRYAPHCLFFYKGVTTVDRKQKVIHLLAAVRMCVMTAYLIKHLVLPISKILADPSAAALLIYLETGREVDPALITEPTQPAETLPTVSAPTEVPAVSFSMEDAALVQLSNLADYAVDIPALLLSELTWDLTREQPQVLILHSHATESYTRTTQCFYTPSGAYRTLDTEYNMVRVGEALKAALEAKGIAVIHDTTLHDHPQYNDAYIRSRETAKEWLARYPSICLVVDLHRDAAGESETQQLCTAASVNGQLSSQRMLVVGSDAGGRIHPNWKENMALAAKLHAQLEKRYPGICRPISFRTERFNQDLSAGALLIEVGAAGDTLEQALVAVEALAEGISDLAFGTVTAGSTS